MFTERDLEKLDVEINKLGEEYFKSIMREMVALLQFAIMKNVYLYYQPNTYERTYQLINSVRAEIQDNTLYVFVDTRRLYYESVYGFEVTDAVPYYVENGHQPRNYTTPIRNQFHYYLPPRHYLELAQEAIRGRYGIEVEIDMDVPIS